MSSFFGFMLGLGQAIGGAALLIAGGPVAVIAGGIIMGSGISGGVNSVQQANSNRDFSWGEYTKNCAIGGLSGAITGGAGSVGGALGAKVGTELGKQAIKVGMISASGAVNTVVTKKINNEEVKFSDCLTGAVVGAVGAGCGAVCSKIPSNSAVSKIVTATVSGGVTGVATKIIANIIEEKYLSQSSFTQYLMAKEYIDQRSADQIYKQLEENYIVRYGKINSNYRYLIAQSRIKYSYTILSLFNQITSITNGVGESLLFGALSGAISSSATETAKYRKPPSQTPYKPTTANESQKSTTTKDGQKPTLTNDISKQESKPNNIEKLIQANKPNEDFFGKMESNQKMLKEIGKYNRNSKSNQLYQKTEVVKNPLERVFLEQNKKDIEYCQKRYQEAGWLGSKIQNNELINNKYLVNINERINENGLLAKQIQNDELINKYRVNLNERINENGLLAKQIQNDELQHQKDMFYADKNERYIEAGLITQNDEFIQKRQQQLDTKTVINKDKKIRTQKSEDIQFIKKGDYDYVRKRVSGQMIPGYQLAEKIGVGINYAVVEKGGKQIIQMRLGQALDKNFLKSRTPVQIQHLKNEMKQIQQRMKRANVVHQDIKLQNFVIDKNNKLKLIDNDNFRQLNENGYILNDKGQKMLREVVSLYVNNETEGCTIKELSNKTDDKGFENAEKQLDQYL